MSPENIKKQSGRPQPKNGLKQTIEHILDRVRQGLEDLVDGVQPSRPKPVPVPVPVRRLRVR